MNTTTQTSTLPDTLPMAESYHVQNYRTGNIIETGLTKIEATDLVERLHRETSGHYIWEVQA